MSSSTSSLGFAAYLLMHNHKMICAPIKGGRKFKFEFDLDSETISMMYQEYAASQFNNFDTILQTLRRSLRNEDINLLPK